MQLKIDNISKQYSEDNIIKKTSFDLNTGLYGFLGANGSGKTTLLRIICGLVMADTGTVFYDNQDIHSIYNDYKRILGYLPQNFGFYPDLTVFEYLKYMATLKAIRPIVARFEIEKLSNKLNFNNLLNEKMHNLSGGNIHRIGIAQALLNDPHVLILDEPTTSLDPSERIEFNLFLHELAKNKIIIFSSHIVSDLEYGVSDLLLITSKKTIIKASIDELIRDFPVKISELKVDDKTQYINKPNVLIQKCTDYYNIKIYSNQNVPNAHICTPTLSDIFFYYSKSGLYM